MQAANVNLKKKKRKELRETSHHKSVAVTGLRSKIRIKFQIRRL
jgi:hypothetical protein